MLEQYPHEVKIVVKQYPLNNHCFAFPAAMGAMAANNQGKFWAFHKALLKNYNTLNEERILSIAKELNLDMQRYHSDSKSPANRTLIAQDWMEGHRIGVEGTPAVFLNGKKVKNRQIGDLIGIIARKLKDLEKNFPKRP